MNNNNLSIRKTPLDSNIVPYTYGTHMLLDMCILRKKYDNFIMLVKFHKNQDCDYDFMEDKKKRFLFFTHVSLNTIGNETFMINEIQRLCRKHKRFVIVNLLVNIVDKEAHGNLIIIDTKNKEVYRFAPHGSMEIHKKLDKLLVKFFVKVNPKYKFIKIEEYLPYFFFQALEISLELKDGKHPLDTGGSCYYWCIYFLKLRLKFPDMDIMKLAEKCLNSILASKKTDMRRLIRNHAQHIERLSRKEYPKLLGKIGNDNIKPWEDIDIKIRKEICKIYKREFKY